MINQAFKNKSTIIKISRLCCKQNGYFLSPEKRFRRRPPSSLWLFFPPPTGIWLYVGRLPFSPHRLPPRRCRRRNPKNPHRHRVVGPFSDQVWVTAGPEIDEDPLYSPATENVSDANLGSLAIVVAQPTRDIEDLSPHLVDFFYEKTVIVQPTDPTSHKVETLNTQEESSPT